MTRTAIAALLLALGLGTAQAATLQLTVTDKDGKPAPDVVVLVQLPPPLKNPPKPSAAPVLITQENSRFVPFLTVVPAGSVVRFSNKDGYDHHVRSTPSGPLGSMPAAKSFELRLAAAPAPGAKPAALATAAASSGDVRMDAAGPIGLGCHLHGSMRGQLFVTDTPWFAKTDAAGMATIDNAPDGAVQVTLWHPDQLQDQAVLPMQLSAVPVKSSAQLNFVPRRRRG